MGAPSGEEGASLHALCLRAPTNLRLAVSVQATEILVNDPALDHEYLPITGLPEFTSAAARLIFGSNSPVITEERVTSVQTISGTGANHLGALFLSKFYGWNDKRVYLSDPTWGKSVSSVSPHLPRITHITLAGPRTTAVCLLDCWLT